jgi:hypothetical protein
MKKSPWSHVPEMPVIMLPDLTEITDPVAIAIDPSTLPQAELGIGANDDDGVMEPLGVAVAIDNRVIARLAIEQVLECAKQIRQLQRTARKAKTNR